MAMVANHFGHRIDLVTLRSQHNVSLKGANMQQLMLLPSLPASCMILPRRIALVGNALVVAR